MIQQYNEDMHGLTIIMLPFLLTLFLTIIAMIASYELNRIYFFGN